jgi:flavin reductase (DIM6/NTAB) family NADH-FMN oxidoreductase RutF
MFKDISELETPEIYQYLTHGVVPRPIAWVSTQDKSGTSNLAPYSFFSVASVNPPVLTITSVPARDKTEKDTLKNLLDTQEAVIHIVTEDMIESMNQSCAHLASGVSEIETIGIETIPSQRVQPPSITNTRFRFECRLKDTLELSRQPGGGILILLDVIGIFVDDGLMTESGIQSELHKVVGKLGGDDYSDTNAKFKLTRPQG